MPSKSDDPPAITEAQAIELAREGLSRGKRPFGPVTTVRYAPPNERGRGVYYVEFAYAGPPVPEEARHRIPPADHPTVVIVNAQSGKCSFLAWR